MKKKTFLASSLFLTTAVTGLVLAFLRNDNLFINALSEESEPHQIILTHEDTTEEKESTYTKYFKLHQDNATMSGFSFDSTSEECLIMADGDRGVGGSWICFGEVNPLSGTCVSLIVTFSLTNIKSFTEESSIENIPQEIMKMKFDLEAKNLLPTNFKLIFQIHTRKSILAKLKLIILALYNLLFI